MLSYRHYFHAGNQADVFKHCALTSFLSIYTKKEKPFSAFDLHAGAGIYNLASAESYKTEEAEWGIIPFFKAYKDKMYELPISIKEYLSLCSPYMEKNSYPGSPEIIRHFLRKEDSLTLTELQNKEYGNLKKLFKKNKNIFIHRRNGYEALPALTPPLPARGFVLFDPSYEIKQDYIDIAASIEKTIAKWSAGVFLVWYPIVERRKKETEYLKTRLFKAAKEKFFCIETIHKISARLPQSNNEAEKYGFGLKGSGLIIINPVWGTAEKITEAVNFTESFFKKAKLK